MSRASQSPSHNSHRSIDKSRGWQEQEEYNPGRFKVAYPISPTLRITFPISITIQCAVVGSAKEASTKPKAFIHYQTPAIQVGGAMRRRTKGISSNKTCAFVRLLRCYTLNISITFPSNSSGDWSWMMMMVSERPRHAILLRRRRFVMVRKERPFFWKRINLSRVDFDSSLFDFFILSPTIDFIYSFSRATKITMILIFHLFFSTSSPLRF